MNFFSLLVCLLGVQKIMVTGTSVKTSKEALRLTRIYPGTLYSTAGKFLKTMFCLAINCIFRDSST